MSRGSLLTPVLLYRMQTDNKVMDSGTSIELAEETAAKLELLADSDESADEVLDRLLDQSEEQVTEAK